MLAFVAEVRRPSKKIRAPVGIDVATIMPVRSKDLVLKLGLKPRA